LRTGRREELDATVAAYRSAVDAAPPDDPKCGEYLLNLAGALFARFEYAGDAADLDAAIDTTRQIVEVIAFPEPERPRHLSNLGSLLRTRFERAGDGADLDAAIDATRQAAELTQPTNLGYMSNLAAAQWARFEYAGVAADLDAAIRLMRRVVRLTPPGHPDGPARLSGLGFLLYKRAHPAGDGADLDAAIDASRQALELTPPGHADRPQYLSMLRGCLQSRFYRTGDGADLDAAIDASRQALELAPPSHRDRPLRLRELGSDLHDRFIRAGDGADLDAAINASRHAVELAPPGHTDRPACLATLGRALRGRFIRAGDSADLDDAIDVIRQAVELTPPHDPGRPERLSYLGLVLQTRFDQDQDGADLDAAINASRQAVELTPPDHLNHAGFLSEFGSLLQRRFDRDGGMADIDAAIDAGRRAVELTPPGETIRPVRLWTLAVALQTRFRRQGDGADLDAAINAIRQAVELTPALHPHHPRYLSILGASLHTRFHRDGDAADLDAAIDTGRQAVELTAPGHATRPWLLSDLGAALHTRFHRDGDAADLDAAMDLFQEASQVPAGTPGIRLRAATMWGLMATEAHRPHDAARGYGAAMELLPRVAWHGVPRVTRMEQLARWAGLATDAAACAVLDGGPARAVELLEQGRSVLWTQALNLRGDLARLADIAPELAARLDSIRAILDIQPAIPVPESGSPALGSALRQPGDADLRRRKAQEWEEVLAEVRGLEGFGHFLAAVPYAQHAAAAPDGPVVILNASRYGCHALIIDAHGDEPEVVSLPALTVDTAAGYISTMMEAVKRADPDTVLDVLDWLWDAAAEPALTALGHTSSHRADDPWPRVWWCPTGPLSLLPVHAAGHHPRNHAASPSADCVPERVISSYTSTLAALARSRHPRPPAQVRHLGIGMVTTPGMPLLPAVSAELRTLARYFPPGDTHQQLTGAQATRASVLAAMPACSWIHLACHAHQVQAAPDRSGFALWDGTLTITDLVSQHAYPRDLAFLSACQTGAGSTRHPDEAVHLAAAMQFLGYRHVIATMWTVADSPSARVADSVYTMLTRSGTPDSSRAAEALHHATGSLRRTNPGNPLLWAPYIHLGA